MHVWDCGAETTRWNRDGITGVNSRSSRHSSAPIISRCLSISCPRRYGKMTSRPFTGRHRLLPEDVLTNRTGRIGEIPIIGKCGTSRSRSALSGNIISAFCRNSVFSRSRGSRPYALLQNRRISIFFHRLWRAIRRIPPETERSCIICPKTSVIPRILNSSCM